MSRSSAGSLASIFAVVFIDLLGFGIALPLLARYGEHFGAGAWLGLLVAVFSAMQFLFAPVWGRLSDRIGRRPVLLVGLAGSAVFYAIFGAASGMASDATFLGLPPIAWLFVSRIGAGISGATISTAQAYIADVTEASDRTKGMALIGVAFGTGFTFGPLLGAAFVSGDRGAPPSPYPGYAAAALSAAAFLAALAALKEPGREASSDRSPDRRQLLGDTVRLALLGEVFVTTAAFAVFESTLTLLSERLGYGQRQNFYLFAFVGATLIVTQGMLVRRIPPDLVRRMVPFGLAVLVAGLTGLAYVGTGRGGSAGLYTALAACVVGVSFVSPALQALLSLTAPADHQGAVLGLGQSAAALARIAGPVAGIRLFQESPPLAYGASAAAVLLGFAAIVPVLAVLRRYSAERSGTSGVDALRPVAAE